MDSTLTPIEHEMVLITEVDAHLRCGAELVYLTPRTAVLYQFLMYQGSPRRFSLIGMLHDDGRVSWRRRLGWV